MGGDGCGVGSVLFGVHGVQLRADIQHRAFPDVREEFGDRDGEAGADSGRRVRAGAGGGGEEEEGSVVRGLRVGDWVLWGVRGVLAGDEGEGDN